MTMYTMASLFAMRTNGGFSTTVHMDFAAIVFDER